MAAEWIEALSSERSEDRAEMLAHHYREALSLAQAAGVDASALRAPAQAALVEATDRARALNAWPAASDFALAALELTEPDDPLRPRLQYRLAEAKWWLGEPGLDAALAARDGFLVHKDPESAALAAALASRIHWVQADKGKAEEQLAEAVALVKDRPRALPLAEQLGHDDLTSHVLNTMGMARAWLGDRDGTDDLRRAVELAEAANAPDAIHRGLNNLANVLWLMGDLDAASSCLARAREVDERFGLVGSLLWLDIEDMFDHDLRGEWDKAVALADAFLETIADSKHVQRAATHCIRACGFVARGDVEAALAEAELLLAHGREAQGEDLAPALATAARVFAAAGRRAEADALFAELLQEQREVLGIQWLRELPLVLVELGRGADYLAAVTETPPSPWLAAGIAVASGDFVEAAAKYERIGARATEACARLLAAESLAVAGRWTEAEEQLARALDFFRAARATSFVRRGEVLLGASPQAASGGMGPSASST